MSRAPCHRWLLVSPGVDPRGGSGLIDAVSSPLCTRLASDARCGGSGRVDAVSSPLCTRLARCGGSGRADASSGLEMTLSSPLSSTTRRWVRRLANLEEVWDCVGVAVIVVPVVCRIIKTFVSSRSKSLREMYKKKHT
jgi:hypothetical protein